jgi:hypothetical protein
MISSKGRAVDVKQVGRDRGRRAVVQPLLAIAPETMIARVRACLEAERSLFSRSETLSEFLEGLAAQGCLNDGATLPRLWRLTCSGPIAPKNRVRSRGCNKCNSLRSNFLRV